MTAAAAAPVLLIGIGNPMRRDDGVGIEAVDHLRGELGADPDVEVVTLDGECTRLVETWSDAELAVVVDAVRAGSPPGSVHRYEVGRDRLPPGRPGPSSHSAGIAEAIDLGRALDRLPDRLVVYGVEIGDVEAGPGLSAPVGAALPGLVQQIRAEVLG